jgi:hypothetical protein
MIVTREHITEEFANMIATLTVEAPELHKPDQLHLFLLYIMGSEVDTIDTLRAFFAEWADEDV